MASSGQEVLGRDTAAGHLSGGQDPARRKYTDVRLGLAGEVEPHD